LPSGKHKVAVIGSGSWGTALAKIAAQNVAKNNKEFHSEVRMWVRQKHVRLVSPEKEVELIYRSKERN